MWTAQHSASKMQRHSIEPQIEDLTVGEWKGLTAYEWKVRALCLISSWFCVNVDSLHSYPKWEHNWSQSSKQTVLNCFTPTPTEFQRNWIFVEFWGSWVLWRIATVWRRPRSCSRVPLSLLLCTCDLQDQITCVRVHMLLCEWIIMEGYISVVSVRFDFSASAIFLAPPAPMLFFCKLSYFTHWDDS